MTRTSFYLILIAASLSSFKVHASATELSQAIDCLSSMNKFSADLVKHPQNNLKIPPDISFDAGRVTPAGITLLPDPTVRNKWHFLSKGGTATSFIFRESSEEIYVLQQADNNPLIVRHNHKKSDNSFYTESFAKEFEELELLDHAGATSKDKIKKIGHEAIMINLSPKVAPASLEVLQAEIARKASKVFDNFTTPNASDLQQTISSTKWKSLHISALKKCLQSVDTKTRPILVDELKKFKVNVRNSEPPEPAPPKPGAR